MNRLNRVLPPSPFGLRADRHERGLAKGVWRGEMPAVVALGRDIRCCVRSIVGTSSEAMPRTRTGMAIYDL